MTCDQKIRPFPDPTELVCDGEPNHDGDHRSILRDYAYQGSETIVNWHDGDRRSFSGEWPGYCSNTGQCVLPRGHAGNHAP